jgi:hypothetical protein
MYNTILRVGSLMTYFPLAETYDTGTAYFESLGLIGGSTGMAPIISANKTIPAVDAYSSQLTVAVTDSVLKYTQTTSTTNRFASWNLGATYDKLLGLCFFQMGTSQDTQGLIFSENTYTGSQATQGYPEDMYRLQNYTYSTTTAYWLYKRVGTSYTKIGEDLTICVNDDPYSHVYGLAFYCEKGNPGVQKCFMKDGTTSQWIQILSTTDGAFTTGFQSVGILTGAASGQVGRMIAPFYVWGVE